MLWSLEISKDQFVASIINIDVNYKTTEWKGSFNTNNHDGLHQGHSLTMS